MIAIVQKISHRVRVYRIPRDRDRPAVWSWRCTECPQAGSLHWRWEAAYDEAARHPYIWSLE